MKAFVQKLLGFGERVAEIKRGDAFENEFERIGLILSRSAGEAVQALGALKDLQDLQAVPSLAFSGGVRTAARGTSGVLLWRCG